MVDFDVSMYVDYFGTHIDGIVEIVDAKFEAAKPYVRSVFLKEIREWLNPVPAHYIWKPDRNYYDCSGFIVKDGFVDLNQTVGEFLENEYSGTKTATYISGMGWRYNTYGDDLHHCSVDLGTELMYRSIRECFEDAFSVKLSDDEFSIITVACYEFDEIYDNCVASDFFMAEEAVKFAGIDTMKLIDVLNAD